MDFPECGPRVSKLKRYSTIGIIVLILSYYLYNIITVGWNLSSIKEEGAKMGGRVDDSKNKETKRDPISNKVFCLVKEALKEYNADKTGMTDFALESAGGTVFNTNTEPYKSPTTIFGITLCPGKNGPREMLQPSMLPGECWAFKGSKGSAIIKLLGYVHINSVTLEHISKSISPKGKIDTAPKKFSILGLEEDLDAKGYLLGQYIYDAEGPTLQNFPIKCSKTSYQYIKFKVHSNYGNSKFTCVYRQAIYET